MIARRSVWTDTGVRELLQQFVLVADEVGRLQRGDDAECRTFRGFCEDGHYGGRSAPTGTRQGIYAITPAGRFLASCNSNRPERVVRMLREALAAWQAVPAEARTLAPELAQDLAALRRFDDRRPDDGLVLAEYLRDLERPTGPADWRSASWNEDQVWFTRAEAAALVPHPPEVGARIDVPQRLVERLATLHLVDSVRGQTPPLPAAAVETAALTSEVVGIDRGHVVLRLRGGTRVVERGEWADRDGAKRAQERGVATGLRGRARWDPAAGRFVAFELVAAGQRWGATRYNERADDLAPSPVGFAFVLAQPDHPRVAPAFWWRYDLR